MASKWYPKGLQHVLQGDVTGGLDGATIKAVLLTAGYTFDSTDEILTDLGTVSATATVSSSAITIGSGDKVLWGGATVAFSAVAAGTACNAIAFYWDSGTAETRYLLAYDEFVSPVTPDGSNINVTLNADGIAKIQP